MPQFSQYFHSVNLVEGKEYRWRGNSGYPLASCQHYRLRHDTKTLKSCFSNVYSNGQY